MLGDLMAVFWFAETVPGGGGFGAVLVVGGRRGGGRTVPKGEKVVGVRGWVWMVMVVGGEGVIFVGG